jgi:Uma2 family endonuclease
MTYEEFLRWADEDTYAEWVNGEVVFLSPVSKPHQLIAQFLATLIQLLVERRQMGTVLTAPFQMKTGPDLPGREPDLIFISKDHQGRLKLNHLEGPADLVVEVISPDSRARDRGEKFFEYEQGGVREYWLIDPLRRQVEFYSLGEDGIYRLLPLEGGTIFRSRVLEGLWIKTEWLFQDPHPPVLDVLREWGFV